MAFHRPAHRLAACIVCIATSAFGQAFYPGATSQESAELARFLGFDLGANHRAPEKLQFLSDLLQRAPDNRPVRLRRAELLLDLGQPADAAADLKLLAANNQDFPGVRQAQVELARITGATADELAGYQAWSRMPRNPDRNLDLWIPQPQLLAAHIAELNGDMKAADAAWQQFLQPRGAGSAYYMEYGEFHDRIGQYAAAVKDYQSLLDNPKIDAEFSTQARIHLARSLWALGRIDEAEKQAMTALSRIQENQDQTLRVLLPPAVLAAYTLTMPGLGLADETVRVKDRAQARSALVALAQGLPHDTLCGHEIAAAALADNQPLAQSAGQLSKIVKDSPHLEWALWSEVFLGYAAPGEGRRMLKEIPELSIQHAILARQFKAPPPP